MNKLDDAIATTEKSVTRPESRSGNLLRLWAMRMKRAGSSNEAKNALGEEVERLVRSSREIKVPDAARLAYSYPDLLDDSEKFKAVEMKVRRIDSGWYPERGLLLSPNQKFINLYLLQRQESRSF